MRALPSPRREIPAALALIALVVLVYSAGLSNGFVWLDHREIVAGELIVDSLAEIPALFADDRNFAGYHRPIYDLLHSLDRALWGLDPFGFHLSSLVLHAGNVIGVFLLARRLGDSWSAVGPRFALAAMWALHPLNSATVGLIHAKADLFVTSAMLGALAAFARGGIVATAAGAFCFALAVFTKEIAAMLPAVVALGIPWRELPASARRRARTVIAVMAAICLFVLAQRHFVGGAAGYASPSGLLERLRTFVPVWVEYVRAMIVPTQPGLADTTTLWSALPFGARARYAISAVLLLALACGAWRTVPATRPFLVVHALFLVPVAQLVPLLHFRADRFLYLPLLGAIGVVVALVRHALLRANERLPRTALQVGMGALLLAIGSAYTTIVRERLALFRDDETLFRAEIERTPDYREGLAALAAALDRAGKFTQALPFHRRALVHDPRRLSYAAEGTLVVNAAHNALARGRADEALSLIDAFGARATHPREREELAYNRAVALLRLDRPHEALPLLEEYARAHPADAGCRYLLGRAAFAAGDRVLAAAAFQEYLRLEPEAPEREAIAGMLRDP